jgi:glutamate dehydrogenase
VAKGVPEALARRVVTLDALYSTLDIVEVAAATNRAVELVAEIYFELSTRLDLGWLREMIVRLPGSAHWQTLARAAMHDDLSGLQRTIAGEILGRGSDTAAPDALLAAWEDRNARAIERVEQLLGELRGAPAADSAMLAVALRELRNLA